MRDEEDVGLLEWEGDDDGLLDGDADGLGVGVVDGVRDVLVLGRAVTVATVSEGS